MNLPTAPYAAQRQSWPTSGRHILATFDDETIVVYQAYRPSIGRYAAEHGVFGGEFGFGRMSWSGGPSSWACGDRCSRRTGGERRSRSRT